MLYLAGKFPVVVNAADWNEAKVAAPPKLVSMIMRRDQVIHALQAGHLGGDVKDPLYPPPRVAGINQERFSAGHDHQRGRPTLNINPIHVKLPVAHLVAPRPRHQWNLPQLMRKEHNRLRMGLISGLCSFVGIEMSLVAVIHWSHADRRQCILRPGVNSNFKIEIATRPMGRLAVFSCHEAKLC